MKLSKLPKEKLQQLVLVVLVTLMAIGGLGFGLVKHQYESLARLSKEREAAAAKLEEMDNNINRADLIKAELTGTRKVLTEMESNMAPAADPYAWIITTVRNFKLGHKVDVPQFGQSVNVTDMNLIPKFPYKQASLLVAGSAYYHDFGAFIADFENQFPHIRVLNLELERSPDPTPGGGEKLSFKMDVVTLVKPEASL